MYSSGISIFFNKLLGVIYMTYGIGIYEGGGIAKETLGFRFVTTDYRDLLNSD